jgi:hypothetical protein
MEFSGDAWSSWNLLSETCFDTSLETTCLDIKESANSTQNNIIIQLLDHNITSQRNLVLLDKLSLTFLTSFSLGTSYGPRFDLSIHPESLTLLME